MPSDDKFTQAEAVKQFTISPKSMEGAVVTITDDLVYNGESQTAKLKNVKLGGITLTAADYDVTGNQQEKAGDYTLTVTGKGNYIGSVTAQWKIAHMQVSVFADPVSREYDGTLAVEVTNIKVSPAFIAGDDVNAKVNAKIEDPNARKGKIVSSLGKMST